MNVTTAPTDADLEQFSGALAAIEAARLAVLAFERRYYWALDGNQRPVVASLATRLYDDRYRLATIQRRISQEVG
jgi:hypothetical protein